MLYGPGLRPLPPPLLLAALPLLLVPAAAAFDPINTVNLTEADFDGRVFRDQVLGGSKVHAHVHCESVGGMIW